MGLALLSCSHKGEVCYVVGNKRTNGMISFMYSSGIIAYPQGEFFFFTDVEDKKFGKAK